MWIPGAVLSAPALFVAGAASGIHCGLMCGALGVHHARAAGSISTGEALGWLHGGRILGYALLGALAGALGQAVLLHLPRTLPGQVLQALAALGLVFVGLRLLLARRQDHACCIPPGSTSGRHWPPRLNLLVRGLLWALVPCGLLYSLLLLAALSGSPQSGGLLAGAFASGGAPLLAGIGWSGRNRGAALRRGAGWWLTALGAGALAAILLMPSGIASGLCSLAAGTQP